MLLFTNSTHPNFPCHNQSDFGKPAELTVGGNISKYVNNGRW